MTETMFPVGLRMRGPTRVRHAMLPLRFLMRLLRYPRALLLIALLSVGTAHAADSPVITVYKTTTCGCCIKWVEHLQRSGFRVEIVNVDETRSTQVRVGVPRELGSCHTATVGDYWVEGHVPADVIRRLFDEKPPGVLGIAVPGMPPGSPGMEAPNPVQYDVIAYDKGGQISRFATVQGKSRVE